MWQIAWFFSSPFHIAWGWKAVMNGPHSLDFKGVTVPILQFPQFFPVKTPIRFHQEAELLRYGRAMEARCDAIIQESLHSSTNDLE